MYQMSAAFRAAKDRGDQPIVQCMITGESRYIFGKEPPLDNEIGNQNVALWDGTSSVGDGSWWNEVPVEDKGAKVLQFGNISRTLTPTNRDLLTSLGQSELGSVQTVFSNRDQYFSNLLGIEKDKTFLNNDIQIKQGFPGLDMHEFKIISQGRCIEEVLTDETLTLIHEET